MNSAIIQNITRFILFALVQVLVLKRIPLSWESFNFVSFFIYPLFIFLLPLRTPHALVIVLAFVMGITMDIFYDSPGVHGATSVFSAFIRSYVISFLEPREGYKSNDSPTKHHLGFIWFMIYCSVMLFIHLLFYFSVEAFTFYYFVEIWLRTISSFIFSLLIILIYVFLFNPKG